jgi:hypothetical protein
MTKTKTKPQTKYHVDGKSCLFLEILLNENTCNSDNLMLKKQAKIQPFPST